jgi:uroporphyrinogen III methyltransferase/synthase
MAWRNLGAIARKLIECGRPPETPVAVVSWGTTPQQQTATGTLADIAARVAARGLKPPTVTVIGEVVSLRDTLGWFERLPLFGRRIVVTRARHQAGALSRGLRERGARSIEMPTIELRDPESFAPLDRAAREIECYDWLIFTSANGVERFFARLEAAGRDARAIRARVCAIGPATAEELRRHGVRADRVAAEYRAEGVLEVLSEAALAGEQLEGRRILIPRAAVARDLLPRELEARGARVEVVEAYRTVAAEIPAKELRQLASTEEGGADLITFTSSSTAEHCPPELRSIPAASIGPITTETARRLGFNVVAEAREYTVDGLLAAIENYFAGQKAGP